ncbi:MAG: LLM class F420-dependent oxidoreductase [Actinomycetota bacterium]
MKIEGVVSSTDLAAVARGARELEDLGYDGVLSAEITHDPFLPLVVVAEHTERVDIGTSIAVAFARNPMTLANIGYDLQTYSAGRFRMGLGSQIKPHIEKRFSMPWSHPAARMRELILAMRAIWGAWNTGERLDFRGEFYRHTLMTPMFDPGPNPYGDPVVSLAAVGGLMTEVAGEVADGLILHAFTTERYVREVTLPALERGFAKSGRTRTDFEISGPLFVVTGTTDEEMATVARATRQQIAFYGSTPAYRPVLDLHGWGDLGDELHRLSKRGEWVQMGELVDDDVLGTFAVVAEPEQVARRVKERYGDLVDRILFGAPVRADPDRWRTAIAEFHA